MKRLILIFLLCSALMITGCSVTGDIIDSETDDTKIKIITTVFPQYDFAKNIVDEKCEVTLLLSPGMETHSFEPSPKDIIDIGNCDVFIYTGGESWADELLATIDQSDMTVIRLMDVVDVLEEEIVDGMEHDHEHEHEEDHDDGEVSEDHDEHEHEEDHDDGEVSEDHDEHEHEEDHDDGEVSEDHDEHETEWDEHVWTSPVNAKKIVHCIADAMCEIDAQNSQYYQDNAEEYVSKLDELDSLYKEVTSSSSNKTIVVADRFPFRYLMHEYGLEYRAAFSGCSTQTDASPATIATLIDVVNDEQIPIVFYTEQSNQEMADTICESSNAEKMLLHSCHNLTQEEIDSGMDYISLMTQNAENVRKALN